MLPGHVASSRPTGRTKGLVRTEGNGGRRVLHGSSVVIGFLLHSHEPQIALAYSDGGQNAIEGE